MSISVCPSPTAVCGAALCVHFGEAKSLRAALGTAACARRSPEVGVRLGALALLRRQGCARARPVPVAPRGCHGDADPARPP